MYPKGTLINRKYNNFVVFEEDTSNPENEGFICFWNIANSNNNQLIFRKRVSKKKAIHKWHNLISEGWEIVKEYLEAS